MVAAVQPSAWENTAIVLQYNARSVRDVLLNEEQEVEKVTKLLEKNPLNRRKES